MGRLRYAPDVEGFVRILAPGIKKQVRAATDLIRADPLHPDLDVRALRKRGTVRFLRVRVAKHYRIVYSPMADHTYIWRIMHRSEGYDWLERMDP